MEKSKHYKRDRERREKIIQAIGEGKDFEEFIVDRGHINGAEIHIITDNAIIKIYNINTKMLITKLIARPWQIRRYYDNAGKKYPEDILSIAKQHQLLGLNYI